MAKKRYSDEFLAKQKKKLLDLRDELVDSMAELNRNSIRNVGDHPTPFGMHQGDAGSEEYDRSFALNLLNKEQDAVYEIDEALQRIEAGNYGLCENCKTPIPEERLLAIPFARFTVACQEKFEKE